MPRAASSRAPDLITFFEGTGTDDQGRSLSQILAWPDQNLEWSHDYIQTLFPLPERSDYQYTVAVVDERVFDAFRARKELRDSLRTAFRRILSFYGFELHEGKSGAPVVSTSYSTLASKPRSICSLLRMPRLDKDQTIAPIQKFGIGEWITTISA
jgi:hypothetical protein